MAACGHMYLDQGEELEVGTAANNLLSFSAALVPSANTTLGQVRTFPPPRFFHAQGVHVHNGCQPT